MKNAFVPVRIRPAKPSGRLHARSVVSATATRMAIHAQQRVMNKTCTLTNDDQQATITVVKVVNNDNGGTAAPDDFR